jgi:hypothetical protein
MIDTRWRQIEDLFHAAIELEPALRKPFLAKACADDEELRRENRRVANLSFISSELAPHFDKTQDFDFYYHFRI